MLCPHPADVQRPDWCAQYAYSPSHIDPSVPTHINFAVSCPPIGAAGSGPSEHMGIVALIYIRPWQTAVPRRCLYPQFAMVNNATFEVEHTDKAKDSELIQELQALKQVGAGAGAVAAAGALFAVLLQAPADDAAASNPEHLPHLLQANPSLKTLISIAGWSFSTGTELFKNPDGSPNKDVAAIMVQVGSQCMSAADCQHHASRGLLQRSACRSPPIPASGTPSSSRRCSTCSSTDLMALTWTGSE